MLRKQALGFAALFAAGFALAACGNAPRSEAAADRNPFASAQGVDPSDSSWTGRVLERLDAGSYVYLKIERAGAEASWVVTAEAIATDAERVRVRVLRRVNHFDSKRLSRSFSPLFFGIVRKDPS